MTAIPSVIIGQGILIVVVRRQNFILGDMVSSKISPRWPLRLLLVIWVPPILHYDPIAILLFVLRPLKIGGLVIDRLLVLKNPEGVKLDASGALFPEVIP